MAAHAAGSAAAGAAGAAGAASASSSDDEESEEESSAILGHTRHPTARSVSVFPLSAVLIALAQQVTRKCDTTVS